MGGYTFYWSLVWVALPDLLQGALVTLQITVLSVITGLLVAAPLSLARRAGRGYVYVAATAWVEVARNTPALLQIYMAYFGLGAIGVHVSSYAAVLAAIAFNNAGYLAEVLRGGLDAVPAQQMPAARSLGMSRLSAYIHVVFPQVFRVVFFPFVNQVNWAMLNSSLGVVIGLRELTGATQFAQSASFRTFEFFIVAALLYYVISKTVVVGAGLGASRLFRVR